MLLSNMENKQTTDDLIVEAAVHFIMNDDNKLERISRPFEAKHGPKLKLGVNIASYCPRGYGYINYRRTPECKRVKILEHRLVFYLVYGYVPDCVDHIDREPQNNHPDNLRACTRAGNAQNRSPSKDSTSRYLGVHMAKIGKPWRAAIRQDGKQKAIGVFDSEIDAAKAYDAKARELFGEFANPNFPV